VIISTPPQTAMSSQRESASTTAAVAANSTGLYQVMMTTIRTLANAVKVACRRPYAYAEPSVGSV
jgi:hypothetical protein